MNGHELQSASTAAEADGGVRAVATALDLLGLLAVEPDLGVAAIGRRLGIAKSTAYRMVTTLCAKGFVQKVPETKSYRLGLRLHELGQLVASRSQLRDHALPLLESLRAQTGETVHLAIPEGSQMFYVERLESYHGLRFSSRVARMRPIYLTSSGKAVAAFNPAVAEAAMLAGFEAKTPRTIRTKAHSALPGRDTPTRAMPSRSRRTSQASPPWPRRARPHPSRPRCHLGRRPCRPCDRRRAHRPDGPSGASGCASADEHRASVVEWLGLPLNAMLSMCLCADRQNDVLHNRTKPFQLRRLSGMMTSQPSPAWPRLSP